MAQRSEDGVGKTSEMSRRHERAVAVWTRSAISIQASSRDEGCIKQAGHTEAPDPARKNLSNTPLQPKGRSQMGLIASAESSLAARRGAVATANLVQFKH